jgi:hypothetical protein
MALSGLIDNALMREVEMGDDYAVLFYGLRTPLPIEALIERLDMNTELVPLYHFTPSKETACRQEACFYSFPSADQMWKLNAVSDAGGKVEELAVTLFESMEVMSFDLLHDLHLHDARGTYYERRSEAELIADFT